MPIALAGSWPSRNRSLKRARLDHRRLIWPAPNSPSVLSGRPVEGTYNVVVAAGGTMAYVIGISAPIGQLEKQTATLRQIARSFAFVPPRGQWIHYQSPAGGFTMTLPQSWSVESGDGRSGKDNIDWVARDPQKPLSRAFQWCPRFCSPPLLQDPLHALRGYQPGQIAQNHEQICVTSLSQIAQNVRLTKFQINQELTQAFRRLNQEVARLMATLNAGQMDVTVYDCLAHAQVDGQAVVVAFITGVQTMALQGAFGASLMDYSVTLRGWCAEPNQFLAESPLSKKSAPPMQLTPAFLNRILRGNQMASEKIRETYAYMNQLDDQIRQSRWDTMDDRGNEL